MIKHIVMWDVRGETPEQKKDTARLVKSAFESLAGKIPGLTRLEVGMNVSGVDYACDVVLYTELKAKSRLRYARRIPSISVSKRFSKIVESPVTRSTMSEPASLFREIEEAQSHV
jgi:hypothetical protein